MGPGLHLAAARVQDGFGVAVRLSASSEHQLQCGLELGARREVGGHGRVVGVSLVLTVDYGSHGLEGARHLVRGNETVMEPIRDVLARNAQRRAVLHQGNVVDVRDLRAADPLADPADHVPQDALRIVLQLVLDFLVGQTTIPEQGERQNGVEVGAPSAGQLGLNLTDVHPMVVRGV